MDNPGDAYSPLEIARRVKQTGTTKANLGFVPTMVLAILAGAFISFGALLYTIVITDSPFGYGPTHWLGGYHSPLAWFWLLSQVRSFLPATI